MGLYVHSLSRLPLGMERDYYLYVLDYSLMAERVPASTLGGDRRRAAPWRSRRSRGWCGLATMWRALGDCAAKKSTPDSPNP
jgi:hypothetical protein